jgi:DNA invertase Pin-like site-specific DNA recombinase
MRMRIGYARVSTADQNPDLQVSRARCIGTLKRLPGK